MTTSPSILTTTQAETLGKTAMGKDGGAIAKKEKRSVIRRDPEKRRQQNLQAQKKYRDKLRKRLDDLETLAASVAQSKETATNIIREAASPVTSISDQNLSSDETPQNWVSSNCSDEQGAQYEAQPELPSISLADVFVPPSTEKTSMDWLTWDSTTSIDPSYLTMTNYGLPDAEKEFWNTSLVNCGCAVRHVEVRTRRSGCYNSGAELIKVGDIPVTPSDPYANHIRIEAVCTISAMWDICLQLGISECSVCEELSQSPFYRPGNGIKAITNGKSEAVDGVVRTVQSIWKTLPPDIRPIKEQITIPHPPYIDIFPFPTLRKNLLNRSVIVDEDELLHDTLQGLMCWGGAGLGRGDRKLATGKKSTGTPWDHRSWEAKPWFIRKYWVALGGEDGELVRQSEWWRSTRGEEVDIWSSEEPCPVSKSPHGLFNANDLDLHVLAGGVCKA